MAKIAKEFETAGPVRKQRLLRMAESVQKEIRNERARQ